MTKNDDNEIEGVKPYGGPAGGWDSLLATARSG